MYKYYMLTKKGPIEVHDKNEKAGYVSYLRNGDQEDCKLRPAQAKS
jgi:hypothetical protein